MRLNIPLSLILLGPPRSGKTSFLATLAQQSQDLFEELSPAIARTMVSPTAEIWNLDQLRVFSPDSLDASAPDFMVWKAESTFVKVQEISILEGSGYPFSLMEALEQAQALYILVPPEEEQPPPPPPPPPLLQASEDKKGVAEKKETVFFQWIEGLLRSLSALQTKAPFLIFIWSQADRRTQWMATEEELEKSLVSFWPSLGQFPYKAYYFSTDKTFSPQQGKRFFDHGKSSFTTVFHDYRKRERQRLLRSSFKFLGGTLVFFMLCLGLWLWSWNAQIQTFNAQILESLDQCSQKEAQGVFFQAQKKQQEIRASRFLEESLSLFSALPVLEDQLQQFKKKLSQHLLQLPAYQEAPEQLKYKVEEYQEALEGIALLTLNTSGDSYGKSLIFHKALAARLSSNSSDLPAWGRLSQRIQAFLEKNPSRPLEKFLEAVVDLEVQWAIENIWENYALTQVSKERFFQKSYRFLETYREYIPATLRVKLEKDLENSWQKAFQELQEKALQKNSLEERFRLFESLYRSKSGEVIPEADKYMPPFLRVRLKEEMTLLLNQWPNETAEQSWDNWFGGKLERKITQLKQLYSEREQIQTREEWKQFVQNLLQLSQKLKGELPQEHPALPQVLRLMEFAQTLEQSWTLSLQWKLQLSSNYQSLFNTFTPKILLVKQSENENQEIVLEEPTPKTISWIPGELLQLKVIDTSYPHYQTLLFEEPGLNPFRLHLKKQYKLPKKEEEKKEEEVYLELTFTFEDALNLLAQEVHSFWKF
jgi:hypothetical protein